ncbi:hypothetical protein Lalb_Chr20g0116691 [Lupinus albus]|uniref:Uncharacterized protein n=1 Tax=Lupinus albus TaxID=3870 RepID=A0A6A4NXL0_LUPAL|nr:hypothetical protein Lalb_Chr20g0116691 [Lupinus albus]
MTHLFCLGAGDYLTNCTSWPRPLVSYVACFEKSSTKQTKAGFIPSFGGSFHVPNRVAY